jgi:hypothetical protein
MGTTPLMGNKLRIEAVKKKICTFMVQSFSLKLIAAQLVKKLVFKEPEDTLLQSNGPPTDPVQSRGPL